MIRMIADKANNSRKNKLIGISIQILNFLLTLEFTFVNYL